MFANLKCLSIVLIAAAAMSAAEPGGTPIKNEIRIVRYQAATMRDGVKLYGDLYRPVAPGKYPVIIVRTPYGTNRDGLHQTMVRFAQQGYAVYYQDVRGRYESEGKWDPFRYEAQDGHDTIEWAAVQPWSNGKVAMQGGSYLGHVQWAAASQAPPHLVTVFPAVASTNIYANWISFGGAWRLSFNYGWGAVRMPNRIMNPQYWHTEEWAPEELRYDRILTHLPLNTGDELSGSQAVQHYRDWIAHPGYDDYWRSISDEERFSKITVPVHTFGGYFDIFLAGTLNGFTGMRAHGGSEKARRESKMIVGPWGHGASRKFGDVDFGETAYVEQHERELRWNDHYLRGVENGIDKEPPVKVFYMGVNKWRDEQDWPIPGARYTPLYLGSSGDARSMNGNGSLAWAKPTAGAASDQYLYDPLSPVPTLGGNNCCGTPTIAGPRDQRPVELRNDVLVYTTPFLDKKIAIAGPVKMRLNAATDGRDTDWMVRLVDVYPNGFAMNVAEGILRARYRKGTTAMELLEPNKAHEFEIDMAGTANVFLPGHRIRVDITSSNFPQFDRNPNTGEPFGTSKAVRTARQTVYHDATRPSHIVLPVVEAP